MANGPIRRYSSHQSINAKEMKRDRVRTPRKIKAIPDAKKTGEIKSIPRASKRAIEGRKKNLKEKTQHGRRRKMLRDDI